MLPENQTDKIQPIDARCGQIMKVKIIAAMETWLEEVNNLDKRQDRLSAKDRRILVTQWTWHGVSSIMMRPFSRDCLRKLDVCLQQMALMM